MTHRFEVDYKERLEQSRTASNAVRLPLHGYKLYRIYDIKETKIVDVKASGSVKNNNNWQQILWAWVDEFESKIEPAYDVRWLKPKKATLLRMRGHRVELAEPGDRPGRFKAQAVKSQPLARAMKMWSR
jgi:hypothetical protein